MSNANITPLASFPTMDIVTLTHGEQLQLILQTYDYAKVVHEVALKIREEESLQPSNDDEFWKPP